jgi:hemolysin activation/secretion protein
MRFILFLILFIYISLGLPLQAWAQPTAGSLLQQVDKEREKIQEKRELPAAQAAPAQEKNPTENKVKITVNEFRFEGNTLIGNIRLAHAVRSYLHHPITYGQLQDAAAAVGEAYRKKGWAVRAFLPQQNIVDGIVTIKIIEAQFGKLILDPASYSWPAKSKIDAMFGLPGNEGRFLNTNRLERSLLLLDDLPGVTAEGRLQQGEHDGETDLVVKTAKEPLITGAMFADNEGERSTSPYRIHDYVQVANPFKMGDVSSLYLLYSEGLQFSHFEETLPVGNDGWRVGANISESKYKILSSEFKALESHGRSSSVGSEASYPLIRSREQNLNFNFNYDHNFFYNAAQQATSSKYEIDRCTAAFQGNNIDKFAGGGNNYINVAMVLGKETLGTLNSGEDPALQGGFQKATYSFSRQQTILPHLFAYGSISGQVSPDKKLDSSEMFYLGGPDGVRAYPVDEASGVMGELYKAELRWRFLPNYQLSAFYDFGHVKNFGTVKSYSLDGAGLELLWQLKHGWSAKFTWAHRLHDNPNPTTSGYDEDGSLKKDRFWFSIIWQF